MPNERRNEPLGAPMNAPFAVLRAPAALVWAVLVVATALIWILGKESEIHAVGKAAIAPYALVVVALIKIRLVIRYFMEVRRAPRGLQLILDAWILSTGFSIGILYWYGS